MRYLAKSAYGGVKHSRFRLYMEVNGQFHVTNVVTSVKELPIEIGQGIGARNNAAAGTITASQRNETRSSSQ